MKVEIELWQILSALVSFAAFIALMIAGMGKMFLAQFERRMDERAAAQDRSARGLHNEVREAINNMQKAEREMLQWRAELPNLYVRREDYIRNQTVIEMKLDKITDQIKINELRSARHD